MIYSIYFSPTGGTKKVMTALQKEFGKDVKEINLLSPENDYSVYSFGPEDVCLVGVPSFGGRVPAVVLERLRVMKAEKAKAVAVVVYGNRHYDDTLLELKNELEALGFCVIAGVTANAKHSIFKQYGAGRPDADDKADLQKFAEEILCKLKSLKDADEIQPIAVPGNVPYKEYPGHPLKPITSQSGCVLCKSCVKKCPTAAIPWEAPNTTINDLCITCMRCIAVCPFDARSLDKAAVAGAAEKMAPAFAGRKPNELFI